MTILNLNFLIWQKPSMGFVKSKGITFTFEKISGILIFGDEEVENFSNSSSI